MLGSARIGERGMADNMDMHKKGENQMMTDNNIIKALECCKMPVGSGACNNCPLDYQRKKRLTSSEKSCTTLLFDYSLDLINRQRAEIERKGRILESYALQYGTVTDKDVLLKRAKAEAVKEFCDKRGIEYVETDI